MDEDSEQKSEELKEFLEQLVQEVLELKNLTLLRRITPNWTESQRLAKYQMHKADSKRQFGHNQLLRVKNRWLDKFRGACTVLKQMKVGDHCADAQLVGQLIILCL